MVEVKQKDKENSEGVIRRFTRQVQQSGTLPKARKQRFRIKKTTKRDKKKRALYNLKLGVAVSRLKKMGIFDDEKLRDVKKKMNEK